MNQTLKTNGDAMEGYARAEPTAVEENPLSWGGMVLDSDTEE